MMSILKRNSKIIAKNENDYNLIERIDISTTLIKNTENKKTQKKIQDVHKIPVTCSNRVIGYNFYQILKKIQKFNYKEKTVLFIKMNKKLFLSGVITLCMILISKNYRVKFINRQLL